MKINNEIAVVGLLFVLGVFASNAVAASVVGNYDPNTAFSDPIYHGGNSHHAMVLGDGHRYVFAPGDGSLIEYDDGTARLSGTVYSTTDANRGFAIDILLEGRTGAAPPDSPKKELLSTAYIDNGGPVDPGDWYYYATFAGTFDGLGELAGTVLQITQRGPAFQFGIGANNKNINFGGSGWFWAEDAHGNRSSGDFNIELRAVPIPAALQLMISALAALGFAARRRRQG